MGKKEKKFIALSEIDHKLQFINVIAVIGDITPTIHRSKLTKIDLCLLDETVKIPGFNVKLNMESEMLNHFLNVAKRGFIIQLSEMKVTKNEGEVYGEVQEEDEITLYNDNSQIHKWYPDEKPTAVTDTVKLKILSMVKWKKDNFNHVEVLQEKDKDKSKTRRSGLNSDGKSQSSNSLNKKNIDDSSTDSNNRTPKSTKNHQQLIENLPVSKENKMKDTTSSRSKLERITPINRPIKRLRANKTLTSSEESESPSTNSSRASISERITRKKEPMKRLTANKTFISSEESESPSTNSSRASISSSSSRVTRATDASNLNKSSSLSSLNKNKASKTLNKSLSLSRLNKSQSQTNLNNSKVLSSRKKVTKGVEAREVNSESDSLKSTKLTRSISTPRLGRPKKNKTTLSSNSDDEISGEQSVKLTRSITTPRLGRPKKKKTTLSSNFDDEISGEQSIKLTRSISTPRLGRPKKKKTTLSSNSDDEISGEQSSLETHACSLSSINREPDKEIKVKSRLSQSLVQSPAVNKNKDISNINLSRKSSRNKTTRYTEVKNVPANKEQSQCVDSETEKVIPDSKNTQKIQGDCVSRDTEKTIATVKTIKTKINRSNKFDAGITDDKVETRGANDLESNSEFLTKAEEKSISEEKPTTFETLKRTRQMIKNKTEESRSLGKTDSPGINVSNCVSPNTTSKLIKLAYNTNREFRRRKIALVSETEVNSQLGNNIHNRNVITMTKGADSETASPTRKKTCLTYGSGHSSDTSIEASPKSKCKPNIGKNPTLNSSDSTLSESSNRSVNKISSYRESPQVQKRGSNQIDISSELVSVSRKKLKLDQETIVNKTKGSRPSQENDLNKQINEDHTGTYSKVSETVFNSKAIEVKKVIENNRNNNENINNIELSNKDGISRMNFKINENRNPETNKDLKKLAKTDKEDVISLPKTRKQVMEKSEVNEDVLNKQTRNTANCTKNTVKSSRESGKCGNFERYLRPLTRKLNFISVENISDISLYDLEEVYVPEKFDLQCKVVSQFVLFKEGIQVVRVQDGTICKCSTLKIPERDSWDVITKEILDNPIVEKKSQYIDIIIFNYFRLDFPIQSGKFFRINNVMAVKFQLKRDPRQEKKSNSELFFCVEGQNANNKKLHSQQIKELQERIAVEHQKSTLSATARDEAVVEKHASDLLNFKIPSSPKMDGKNNLSPDKKSPNKTKPVVDESESGLKVKTRKLNDLDLDNDSEVAFTRGRSPSEEKPKKENLRNNIETCREKVNNLKAKISTSSSDETIMGETPPLLREINEIMQEESALGLPLTVTEDVHLKNSGSEVTFSQFCEEAKLKGDNFRTSTQDVEADVQKIDYAIVGKSSDLHKEVTVASKEVILLEDTSKMEPLVYCPSGSSASSAVCVSLDKAKTTRDIQDSQQCSVSVICGTQVKAISDLKPNNSESQEVIIDNTSDLSNSSSVKVISSNSSVGTDLEVLGSKDVSKNQSTTKVTEVESTVSSEIEALPIDVQKKDSLSPSKSSVLLKDKESGSLLGSVCISGKNLNKTITNEDIAVVSDNSSNSSFFTADNNTAKKPMSSFNASANVNDNFTVHNIEQRAKLIPDRCFYKSPTTALTLTEHELNEIYDDENSPVKYFSYCHNRDLPMLTLDVIEKIKNSNSLSMTVTFISISPAFTDSWKERCIKARCPSCDKFYEVYNAVNNKNNDNTSDAAAISVGSHIVCPDSQCCNQILENPEFHFSVEFKLEDGTPLSALLGGKHAEEIFGCSAPETVRNESALSRVAEILEKITKRVDEKHPTKVVVKREDICNPKSGPLCLAHVGV